MENLITEADAVVEPSSQNQEDESAFRLTS